MLEITGSRRNPLPFISSRIRHEVPRTRIVSSAALALISQTEMALTQTVVSSLWIVALARLPRRRLFSIHQTEHGYPAERSSIDPECARRCPAEGISKLSCILNRPLMPPRPTVEFLLLQRHQSGYRLACLRDDDLLAGGRFLDESGQVRLCGVHVDRLHSLAKLSLTYQVETVRFRGRPCPQPRNSRGFHREHSVQISARRKSRRNGSRVTIAFMVPSPPC